MQAYTTAAVVNFSIGAPETPVQPSDFMPHYKPPVETEAPQGRKFTEDEIQDWNIQIMNLAAEMKQGHGAMLDQMRKESNAGKRRENQRLQGN